MEVLFVGLWNQAFFLAGFSLVLFVQTRVNTSNQTLDNIVAVRERIRFAVHFQHLPPLWPKVVAHVQVTF